MKNLSRRDFLKLLATGMGGVALEQFLTACGIKPTPVTPDINPSATTAIPTGIPAETAANPQIQEEATPGNIPDLVVVRGGQPEEMVRRALASLGGMERFVQAGSTVVIKPNICVDYRTYEYAATTNPWVVGALVKLCLETGAASVKVFDFPFGGTPEKAYINSGIKEQVEAAGGKMDIMSSFKFVSTKIPVGVNLKKTDAYQDALEADVLIDVPIAKHHGTTRLTLGMKNLMGLVRDRGALHSRGIGQCIADLASLFRPSLTVVDAVRILTANGPTGGNLDHVRQLDTLIASPDIVAADAYATRLFGLTAQDVAYIPAAAGMGLGRMDLENITTEEISLG
jgi:uncharacterized protein (DUF362 family)